MPQKYLHYFGNEASESLLEAYGIITKDQKLSDALRPKQCPNCDEPNKPDSKFCAKCRMVLTYDAYSETVEDIQIKDNEVKNLKEQMAAMQEAQKEILDLLKDPIRLSEAVKANQPETALDMYNIYALIRMHLIHNHYGGRIDER